MATRNALFPIFELQKFPNTYLGKVTKFQFNSFSRLGAAFKNPEGGNIPPSPIRVNTGKRNHPRNPFEKDFFKLMNNSVFGKTMENLRKRVDVRLETNVKKLLKLASKPIYVSSEIFNENLVAVHKIKETLTLNRPAYVGMCILNLSKTLMYDFDYGYIQKKYGSKARLRFTDTDSLTHEIETEDAYQNFWNDEDKFDNSDYPENSTYYDTSNKKVIGKFKDEAAGIPIVEFVGLRSKMYSFIKNDGKGGKTA